MMLRLLTRRSFSTASTGSLRKTALYDWHLKHNAKPVDFAGWAMPLTYGNVGQVASHLHVRNSAGLFDVGHMLQTKFRGPGAQAFLESLVPSSLASLKPYTSTLSIILNEQGGIIDDTVITKHDEDSFYVVTNAGRRDRDLDWFQFNLEKWNARRNNPVELEILSDWGLLALQGPQSSSYLQSLTSYDLRDLTFGKSAYISIDGGFNVHVARGGYTGEDGFEISVPPNQTVDLASTLSKDPVQLAGLAARDSLRLEAGLCLYGQDLDEDTTPVEAGLSWVIGKSRRGENASYVGAKYVEQQLSNKDAVKRRRVGLVVDGAPARQGAKIFSRDGTQQIGTITSGIPSPTLAQNIAMGYVSSGNHKSGTELKVEVRGKMRNAVVTKMPFVKTGYWRG